MESDTINGDLNLEILKEASNCFNANLSCSFIGKLGVEVKVKFPKMFSAAEPENSSYRSIDFSTTAHLIPINAVSSHIQLLYYKDEPKIYYQSTGVNSDFEYYLNNYVIPENKPVEFTLEYTTYE